MRYAPSADVKASVDAFLRTMADLAGDPTLPLFTEGSRLMRAHYPLARFEELTRLERINASRPLAYHQSRATTRWPRASESRPRLRRPILLHREQSLWRVDQVETWKNLFFDNDGNHFLRNSNTPYAFGLGQFGEGRYYDIEAAAARGHARSPRSSQDSSRRKGRPVDSAPSGSLAAERFLDSAGPAASLRARACRASPRTRSCCKH